MWEIWYPHSLGNVWYCAVYGCMSFVVRVLCLHLCLMSVRVVVEYDVGNVVPWYLWSRVEWCGVFVHVVCCVSSC